MWINLTTRQIFRLGCGMVALDSCPFVGFVVIVVGAVDIMMEIIWQRKE